MPLDNLAQFYGYLTTGLAYLDPGSGSFILQILLASLLGTLYFARKYWQKILNIFRNDPTRSTDGQNFREEEHIE